MLAVRKGSQEKSDPCSGIHSHWAAQHGGKGELEKTKRGRCFPGHVKLRCPHQTGVHGPALPAFRNHPPISQEMEDRDVCLQSLFSSCEQELLPSVLWLQGRGWGCVRVRACVCGFLLGCIASLALSSATTCSAWLPGFPSPSPGQEAGGAPGWERVAWRGWTGKFVEGTAPVATGLLQFLPLIQTVCTSAQWKASPGTTGDQNTT